MVVAVVVVVMMAVSGPRYFVFLFHPRDY